MNSFVWGSTTANNKHISKSVRVSWSFTHIGHTCKSRPNILVRVKKNAKSVFFGYLQHVDDILYVLAIVFARRVRLNRLPVMPQIYQNIPST